MNTAATAATAGIVVSTTISAGGIDPNHAEGIVVSTPIAAGRVISGNHAEGILVTTAIAAGGRTDTGGTLNHVEAVVAV